MLSEIFVYLTLISGITVSFHLCFLSLSAVLSNTFVTKRTHDLSQHYISQAYPSICFGAQVIPAG